MAVKEKATRHVYQENETMAPHAKGMSRGTLLNFASSLSFVNQKHEDGFT